MASVCEIFHQRKCKYVQLVMMDLLIVDVFLEESLVKITAIVVVGVVVLATLVVAALLINARQKRSAQPFSVSQSFHAVIKRQSVILAIQLVTGTNWAAWHSQVGRLVQRPGGPPRQM